MVNAPRLHHYCQNVTKGSLQTVVEMYKMMGFEIVYTPPGEVGWMMVGQKELRFAIQIAEVSDEPIVDIHKKLQTHIGFISDDPSGVLNSVQEWAARKNIAFRKGGWSELELYFDLPDIFVNFVVEVMHTSIEEE